MSIIKINLNVFGLFTVELHIHTALFRVIGEKFNKLFKSNNKTNNNNRKK